MNFQRCWDTFCMAVFLLIGLLTVLYLADCLFERIYSAPAWYLTAALLGCLLLIPYHGFLVLVDRIFLPRQLKQHLTRWRKRGR